MPRALLVRIGIDSTRSAAMDCGGWNAPVDLESREFVYVPLLQSWPELRARPTLRRGYRELMPALARFAAARKCGPGAALPRRLHDEEMHLDPDFEHLTYGDSPTPRGKRIGTVTCGDWLVFIAGLQPIQPGARLHYAIVGKFVVDEVLPAASVPEARAHENAHTRPQAPPAGDVVIRARRGESGRLRRCIGIGELRGINPRYRVTLPLLEAWGGLHSNDGYIQRGSPFELFRPEQFMAWWQQQGIEIVPENWE
jgi:hypothetical protein